jgi:hypothetical protein
VIFSNFVVIITIETALNGIVLRKKRKQVVYCVPKKILAHPIGWFLLFTCLLTTCTSVSRFEGHGTIVSVLLLKMSMVIVLKDQYLSC